MFVMEVVSVECGAGKSDPNVAIYNLFSSHKIKIM